MKIGVPGEFHEDRWQRTAEDSERRVIPRTREASGAIRIQVIAWQSVLLTGLWHGDPTHRYLSVITAWRRGTSGRSSERRPCPQVLQKHPRMAKGSSGRSSERRPCPQVLQRHPRMAKGRKSVPLTGLRSGLRPGLAWRPCPQVLQRHPRVAKGLLDGLWHGHHAHSYLRGITAWRRGLLTGLRPVRRSAYSENAGIRCARPARLHIQRPGIRRTGPAPGIFSGPRHIQRVPGVSVAVVDAAG